MIFLGSCLYIYIGDRHGYGEETYYLGKFGNSINITREIECSRKYVYRNFKCSLKEHYFSDGKESHIYYDGCDKVDFLNDDKNVHDSQQRQCFKICKAFSSKGDLRIHPGFGLNDRISVTKTSISDAKFYFFLVLKYDCWQPREEIRPITNSHIFVTLIRSFRPKTRVYP